MPGMGKELCEASPAAPAVFDRAESICSKGPLHSAFPATPGGIEPHANNTQPCVYCVDLAAAGALRARRASAPDAAAGFSLGEVAAMTFCGRAYPEDGFRLVCKRAECMD